MAISIVADNGVFLFIIFFFGKVASWNRAGGCCICFIRASCGILSVANIKLFKSRQDLFFCLPHGHVGLECLFLTQGAVAGQLQGCGRLWGPRQIGAARAQRHRCSKRNIVQVQCTMNNSFLHNHKEINKPKKQITKSTKKGSKRSPYLRGV